MTQSLPKTPTNKKFIILFYYLFALLVSFSVLACIELGATHVSPARFSSSIIPLFFKDTEKNFE